VFTRLRRLSAGATAQSSTPKTCGDDTRPSTPLGRPTSRLVPVGEGIRRIVQWPIQG